MSNSANGEPLQLEANINGKIEQIEIPEYSIRYPNYNTVKLAAIKNTIDQPRLDLIYAAQSAGKPVDETLSTPLRLVGSTEKLKKFVNKDFSSEIAANAIAKKSSCTSGREHTNTVDRPKKEQFRFNRVRMVPNDWPTHGHLESYFDTNPGLDKFGAKHESNKTFNFRQHESSKYTNLRQADAFKPYGYSN